MSSGILTIQPLLDIKRVKCCFFFSCGEGKEILFDMRIDHPPWTEKNPCSSLLKRGIRRLEIKIFRIVAVPTPYHSIPFEWKSWASLAFLYIDSPRAARDMIQSESSPRKWNCPFPIHIITSSQPT